MSVIRIDLEAISTSRRKGKKKSKKSRDRSRMLKMIMPELGGEQGERLARALESNDRGAVAIIMSDISKRLQEKLKK